MGLYYNGDNSYLFVNRKENFKFKTDNKKVNFLTQFYVGSITEKFGVIGSRKVSFKGNVYDFSVDYSPVDRSDILNIHKYLIVKNNVKSCSSLLYKCLLCC